MTKSTFLAIGVFLTLISLLYTDATAATTAKGHDPEQGRDLVIRMERLRTCEECPHYEIKIFSDGSSMFIGKEAVRMLGTWGNYLRGPLLDARARLEAATVAILRAGEKYGDRRPQLRAQGQRDITNKALQRVVVELLSPKPTVLDFDAASANEDLRAVVEKILDIGGGRYVFDVVSETAPPFFSDPEAVFYWTFPIHREICGAMPSDGGSINIRMYSDGRVRLESVNKLTDRLTVFIPKADIAVRWAWKEPGEIKNLVGRLLTEWKDYANVQRPRFHEGKHGGAHWYTRAFWDRALQWLYVKSLEDESIDLTAAWYYRARKNTSKELQQELGALARYALSQVPPENDLVRACLDQVKQ